MLGRLRGASPVLYLEKIHLAGARSYSTKYQQEHDYSIKPTTYAYTADENRELFDRFPLVTAKAQARRQSRPQKSRMLAREFIEDSMYNPNYGYFSKQAEIFTLPRKIDARKIGDLDSYLDQWAVEYRNQLSSPTETSVPTGAKVPESEKKNLRPTKVSKQLWHTPSELFSPHYGETLARYFIEALNGEKKLIIYETGAGNGTLMTDMLDFIKREHPDIYANTEYHVIEISAQLALKQRAHGHGHGDKVHVHNTSIFDWTHKEERPCFFVALEVWDNLAHDVIRYNNITNEPWQGYVVVDHNNEFTEVYSSKLDKLAAEYLEVRNSVGFKPQSRLGWHPQSQPSFVRTLINNIVPFQGDFSAPEYIPTRQYQFMKLLAQYFPQHHFLTSDFTHFTERIRGYNSPVVQTFMEDTPVTVSTFMVLQGHFDIMFPTDFELARKMYEHVTGKRAAVATNHDFLSRWMKNAEETATKTGENPMLSLYSNADFLYTL